MITELIFLIILVCGLAGALFILFRKMPMLNSLPQNGSIGIRKHRIILDIEAKIKDVSLFFEKQIFLHKFLSWIKVATLKVETRVDVLLHKIRRKAQQIEKEKKDK